MKKFFIIIIICVTIIGVKAQDVHFTQFYTNSQLLNPALSGAFDYSQKISLNYKNQWSTYGSGYDTYSFSYEQNLFKSSRSGFLGIGTNIFYDKSGVANKTLNISLNIAYHLHLNMNNYFSAALSGAYLQNTFNSNNQIFGDQWNGVDNQLGYSSEILPSQYSINNGDFAFGLNWHYSSTKKWGGGLDDKISINVGYAMFHVTQPNYGLVEIVKLPVKHTVFADAKIGTDIDYFSVMPIFLVSIQGHSNEIIAGSLFKFKLSGGSRYTDFMKDSYFAVGGSYRFGDAVLAQFLLGLDNMRFGMSYDFTTSQFAINNTLQGGLEFSFSYIFGKSAVASY